MLDYMHVYVALIVVCSLLGGHELFHFLKEQRETHKVIKSAEKILEAGNSKGGLP